MKKLLILILVLCSLQGFAQPTTADRVVARQALYLKDWWLEEVVRDTAFWNKVRALPTADAVARFVQSKLDSLPAASFDSTHLSARIDSINNALKPALSTLTDGATVTWDYATQGNEATVTLAGNRALSITNLPAGKVVYLTLEVIQDATGSRTLTLPAATKVISGGVGAVSLTASGSATDIISFRWNGTTLFATIGKNYN